MGHNERKDLFVVFLLGKMLNKILQLECLFFVGAIFGFFLSPLRHALIAPTPTRGRPHLSRFILGFFSGNFLTFYRFSKLSYIKYIYISIYFFLYLCVFLIFFVFLLQCIFLVNISLYRLCCVHLS